jgi:hypothetical protein
MPAYVKPPAMPVDTYLERNVYADKRQKTISGEFPLGKFICVFPV